MRQRHRCAALRRFGSPQLPNRLTLADLSEALGNSSTSSLSGAASAPTPCPLPCPRTHLGSPSEPRHYRYFVSDTSPHAVVIPRIEPGPSAPYAEGGPLGVGAKVAFSGLEQSSGRHRAFLPAHQGDLRTGLAREPEVTDSESHRRMSTRGGPSLGFHGI